MKYFLDTEFAEQPGSIELISIGIIAEDGREFYAEVSDFDPTNANEWVRENVLPHLWWRQKDRAKLNRWSRDGGAGGLMLKQSIGRAVRQFVGNDTPEFWGYFCDYDWVVFCWLFGSMIDLPKGWPMYCRDIKQVRDELGGPELPPEPKDEHNALADARWNREALTFLESLRES